MPPFPRGNPARGPEHEQDHANLDDGLPAVLRHHLPDQAGGARYRARGRRGQQHRGAAGPGRVPPGRPHQEDQSRAPGKHVQTPQGGR